MDTPLKKKVYEQRFRTEWLSNDDFKGWLRPRLDQQLPTGLLARNHEVLVNTYKTTTGVAHDSKERTLEPEYAALPPNNRAVEHQRNIHEKLQLTSVKPLRAISTEYVDSYKPVKPLTSIDSVPYFYSYKVGYNIPRADVQPDVPLDKSSMIKHLDPYISSTHFTHTVFRPEDLAGIADKDNVTFWNYADDSPLAKKRLRRAEPLMLLKQEPTYDHSVFKTVATNRILPRFVPQVPNKGLQSETAAQFQPPVSSVPPHSVLGCFPAVMRASSAEILSTPAMYHTEHQHLGTGWPVGAVIEQRSY